MLNSNDQISIHDADQTVEESRKKHLKERLEKGIQEARKEKGRLISQQELDEWKKSIRSVGPFYNL